MKLGFKQCKAIFIKHTADLLLIVVVHVDNCTLAATTANLIKLLKEQLTCYMEITDLGKLHWLLGIEIICNQDEHTVSLWQHFYLKFIIFHFNLDELKSEMTKQAIQ